MAQVYDVDGNRLALLTDGPEQRGTLIALIDGARATVKLLYYIYTDDAAGRAVHAALMAAAGRGVDVALIVDGFGSEVAAHEAFFHSLITAGIDVCVFNPSWGRRYLLRNHQKMAIADDARAIIGGFNVADDYFAPAGETAWRDLGLMIEGEAAQRLSRYFDAVHDWTRQPRARMRDLRRTLRDGSNPAGAARWLLGGPGRRLSPWARTVRDDLKNARSVAMIAAYFAPNPGMLRRLDRIGQHGRARILTASKTDNMATIGAARFTYPGLLRKGVRIFEYAPTRLHTKLILIDDIVYIGSANFDMRSLYLNLEVMLRIDDHNFAAHVGRYIDGEFANACEQRLADYTGWQTWSVKLRRALSYFVVAVMDYNVVRRLNFGAE